MPDLTIATNIPQAQIDAIVAAFVERQGPIPVDAKGVPTMTDGDFARLKIREYVKSVVLLSHRESAAKAASEAVKGTAESKMSGF